MLVSQKAFSRLFNCDYILRYFKLLFLSLLFLLRYQDGLYLKRNWITLKKSNIIETYWNRLSTTFFIIVIINRIKWDALTNIGLLLNFHFFTIFIFILELSSIWSCSSAQTFDSTCQHTSVYFFVFCRKFKFIV